MKGSIKFVNNSNDETYLLGDLSYINQTNQNQFLTKGNMIQIEINLLTNESSQSYNCSSTNDFEITTKDNDFRITMKDNDFHELTDHDDDHETNDLMMEINVNFLFSFTYSQIAFTYLNDIITDENNTNNCQVDYIPNSVRLWNLITSKNNFGVTITIKYLKIDLNVGDYLLVGSGKGVMNTMVKSRAIIENIDNENYYKKIMINSNNAFILLVTHNSLINHGKCIEFEWSFHDNEISPPDQIAISERVVKEASQICISLSCQVFDDENFAAEFKSFIAYHVNSYFQTEQIETSFISSSSIVYFELDKAYISKYRCPFKLAIVENIDPDRPMLTHQQLLLALFSYRNHIQFNSSLHSSSSNFTIVTISNCNTPTIQLWDVFEPLVFIMVPSIIVLVILWRLQNHFKAVKYSKRILVSNKIASK